MIALSVLCAACTGRLGQLSTALLEGAQSAVELSLSLLGAMCAWLGFLNIAEESGASRGLAHLLGPVVNRLFPQYRGDGEVQGKICLNLSANLLGLGNAATPLGISAMEAMARRGGELPSQGMVLFVVMNTASLQLVPANMAAMRQAAGSAAPFSILPQVWLVSAGSLAACMLACKALGGKRLWNS